MHMLGMSSRHGKTQAAPLLAACLPFCLCSLRTLALFARRSCCCRRPFIFHSLTLSLFCAHMCGWCRASHEYSNANMLASLVASETSCKTAAAAAAVAGTTCVPQQVSISIHNRIRSQRVSVKGAETPDMQTHTRSQSGRYTHASVADA